MNQLKKVTNEQFSKAIQVSFMNDLMEQEGVASPPHKMAKHRLKGDRTDRLVFYTRRPKGAKGRKSGKTEVERKEMLDG